MYQSWRLGETKVTAITQQQVLAEISEFLTSGQEQARLIVTPNIAHVKQAAQFPVVRKAYEAAWIATADGWPVALAVQLLSGFRTRQHRVTGVDLSSELLRKSYRVALVGGKEDASERVAQAIANERWGADVVLTEAVPAAELEADLTRADLVRRIADAKPQVILVGLGVPKQEKVALELLEICRGSVILCVGAAIEFAAGYQIRAPRGFQLVGLEWFYRLCREPRRLWQRYLSSAPFFLKALARALVVARRQS
ncbi:WecB/TagA/CpsF family glycosyltransferase [Curtobacterium sp. 260]|uniref:WecB/TagA/CpsF family glycosyltransferase n=1 Tax=Curtobacterium sp. 260 TaxID=2817748 RepID=UPI002787FC5C|nr:WecB/TagA/CpsF family glycosyltransferase [Curtobacterium sp. 260]MDP9736949.1 N-acetylglucosaminyldiphosphoundecaprenol N-acetyl-beta-D-mannosaminyltransferase [Curtobacterium sp. 260]